VGWGECGRGRGRVSRDQQPTGSRPAGTYDQVVNTMAGVRLTGVGRALATYVIPIEGRDEWLAAARRLA
jgi:hypothetical protein